VGYLPSANATNASVRRAGDEGCFVTHRDKNRLIRFDKSLGSALITPASYHPDETWVLEQAEAFKQHVKEEKLSCKLLEPIRKPSAALALAAVFDGFRIGS
jgi:hypothetical protein